MIRIARPSVCDKHMTDCKVRARIFDKCPHNLFRDAKLLRTRIERDRKFVHREALASLQHSWRHPKHPDCHKQLKSR